MGSFSRCPVEEVVFAVAGRGVHEPGAGVHRDVVAENDAERPRVFLGRELAAASRAGGGGRRRVPSSVAARDERAALPVRPAELFGDARRRAARRRR